MKQMFLILVVLPLLALSQEVTEEVMVHDGLERSYILYVPDIYSNDQPAPLVFNLHGYGSNAGQQMIYSNFYTIADTAGFILVYPQGTLNDIGSAYWNSDPLGLSTVDDIGFLSNLIDEIASQYNINLEQVYSTGMSNGGFMSYRLACELSDKIAAVASVTGSMNESQATSCSPEQSVPIMQIHGTADLVVLYEGSSIMETLPIEEVVSYWVNYNQCDIDPIVTNLPDVNTLDLCQAEHYVYENGLNDVSVEFYKIINGGHTWPGAAIPLTGNNTNQDFNASEKIWNFFQQYDINGLLNTNTSGLEQDLAVKTLIKRIDLLGRDVMHHKSKLCINIFDDGSVSKHLIME
tara:strand:- start:795 stop:1841 length:1047 start_codon:yes stop_codon:yes gene_type:complete